MQIAVLALQLALAVVTWRKAKNGDGHSESHEDGGRAHIAAQLQTIDEAEIDMPENWRAYVDARVRHVAVSMFNAVMLAGAKVRITDPTLAQVRDEAVRHISTALKDYRK